MAAGVRNPVRRNGFGRFQGNPYLVEFALLDRKVRSGGINLLEERLRCHVDDELSGLLDVAKRILAPH